MSLNQHSFARLCATVVTISLLLGGCASSPKAARVADLPAHVQGRWLSNGYGYLIDASAERLRLFDVTPTQCWENPAGAALASQYLDANSIVYRPATQTAAAQLSFTVPFEPYPINLSQIPALPERCLVPARTDPVAVFEAVADLMATHYAYFDLYGVDWSQQIAIARPHVSASTSDAELFRIISEMLKPLEDGHLSLSAEVDGEERNSAPGKSSVSAALVKQAAEQGLDERKHRRSMLGAHWIEGVAKQVLSGQGVLTANDYIQYGIVDAEVGYLALITEAGYAGEGESHEAEDRVALNQALDQAMALFNQHHVRGVILDLSVNFGGYDFAARDVAARFASKRQLAYSKYAADARRSAGECAAGQAVITAGSQPGCPPEPFAIYVEPSRSERYEGPVYMLTSDVTVSAGEMLTMAMRALPNVVHIGEPTRGAHSDVLQKPLPNGWVLALSNEVYYDHEGRFSEGRGIEPQIPLRVFDPDNPFVGHLQAVRDVVERIKSGS